LARLQVSGKLAAAAALVALVALGAVLVAGRGGGSAPAGEVAGVIKIGFTYTVGTPAGEAYRNGAMAWWEMVNESGGILVGDKRYAVKLVMLNDEGDPVKARQLYTNLAQTVDFLLGPSQITLQLTAMEVSEEYGKILLVTTPDDEPFKWSYRYSYQVASPASAFAEPALDLISSLDPNVTSVALVFADTPFTRAMAQGVKHWASLKGVHVVFEYYYKPGEVDFAKIARALLQAAPELLVGGGHREASVAELAKAVREAGVQVKAMILFQGDSPVVVEQLGDGAEGIMSLIEWFPKASYSPFIASHLGYEWYGPTVTDFNALYQRLYGENPNAEAAKAFAALLVLQYALEKAGTTDADAVARVLDEARIMTFYGPIEFDSNLETHGRQLAHRPLVGQWQYDPQLGEITIKIVAPPEFANAEPIYPLPPR